MTYAVQTPADLVNLALRRIGFKQNVGSLYDGSAAAQVALDVYAQTRDAFLRQTDAGFCERNLVATLLKQAPDGGYFPPTAWDPTTNPPLPWFYEYAYPADALKVRAIRRAALFVQDFDPQPNTFTVENDNYLTPGQRVILCNVPDAVLVYTAQVTDLTTWDTDALEAFAAMLGRRIAPALVGLDATKLAAADEQNAAMIDTQEEG